MTLGGLELSNDIEKQPLIFNDANEELIGKLLFKSINLFKLLLKLIGGLMPKLIVYSILSFTYLSIYSSWGFDRTIILLLVGVVVFAIRTGNR